MSSNKKSMKVKHLASGEWWTVPSEMAAKGGEAMTRWIDEQIAHREETARRKQQADVLAAEATADRLLALEAQVKKLSDENTRLQHENEVIKNSPLESADAALKLNQTAAQMLNIRADLLRDIEVADKWRETHGADIKEAAALVRQQRAEAKSSAAAIKAANAKVFASLVGNSVDLSDYGEDHF